MVEGGRVEEEEEGGGMWVGDVSNCRRRSVLLVGGWVDGGG